MTARSFQGLVYLFLRLIIFSSVSNINTSVPIGTPSTVPSKAPLNPTVFPSVSPTLPSTLPTSYPTSYCVSGNFSLWSSSAVPVGSAATADSSLELGMQFYVDLPGLVTGVRYYRAATNTGNHTGSLWSSSGQLLASARFTHESASGWQQVLFKQPVYVQAKQLYMVSYHTPGGFYYHDTGTFTGSTGVNSAPVHSPGSAANGWYRYSTAVTYPNTVSTTGTNYWVDVVFRPNCTVPTTMPTVAPTRSPTLISAVPSISRSPSVAPVTPVLPYLPLTAPLSWSLVNLGALNGAKTYFHSANTDKDGSVVAARLAGATGGVSDTRSSVYTISRFADANYAFDAAAEISNLYLNYSHGNTNPLLMLSNNTVVVSSVHRFGLYAAEALHAPLLVAQTLSFANSWAQACSAVHDGSIVFAGCDYGYNGLWLWLKPGSVSSIPTAHVNQLRLASSVLMFRSSDNGTFIGSYSCDATRKIFIHSSITTCSVSNSLYQSILPLSPLTHQFSVSTLADWEWGLPQATINAYQSLWLSWGRNASHFAVVQGSTVAAFAATPNVWSAYLQKNGITPRGLSIYSYWMAQPHLDRVDGTIPLPAYAFYKPTFLTLYNKASSLLTGMLASFTAKKVAKHTRAFVNLIGSTYDYAGVLKLYKAFNISSAWGEQAIDCPELTCQIINTTTVTPCPHIYASLVLGNVSSLLPTQSYQPLTLAQVVKAQQGLKVSYPVYTSIPTSAPSYAPSQSPMILPTTLPTCLPSNSPRIFPSIIVSTIYPSAPPSLCPSIIPSLSPSFYPTVSPSMYPSTLPSIYPTICPSSAPSIAPTGVPTVCPSLAPTVVPSVLPSATPSVSPSVAPSTLPSNSPSLNPTTNPTLVPSAGPSVFPSVKPTVSPSITPTFVPSGSPSVYPSIYPTVNPSSKPTLTPTTSPTVPTINPSVLPSANPTFNPSLYPSQNPSVFPSAQPTSIPTSSHPSITPSAAPTVFPLQQSLIFYNSSILRFNGVSTYYSYGPLPKALGTNLTISLWINLARSGNLVSLGRSNSNFNGELTFNVQSDLLTFSDYSTVDGFNSNVPTLVPYGVRTHVAFVRNYLAGHFYMNGSPIGSISSTVSVTYTNQNFCLGADCRDFGSGNYAAGTMDNIMVYGSALSAAQILKVYQKQVNAFTPSSRPVTLIPSTTPSLIPTAVPTLSPSSLPSNTPSIIPSTTPSIEPSAMPTPKPTNDPSSAPTLPPSAIPTNLPSVIPSNIPTTQPSCAPSVSPSVSLLPTVTYCPAGQYATSAVACAPCPRGQYAADTYQRSCLLCPSGLFAVTGVGASACSSCVSGRFSLAGSTACIQCAAGQYASTMGLSSCLQCLPGTFTAPGSSVCGSCSAVNLSTNRNCSALVKYF